MIVKIFNGKGNKTRVVPLHPELLPDSTGRLAAVP